jgi:hypothetical protein
VSTAPPLRFERNDGQFDGRVSYAARLGGATLFLTEDAATLALRAPRGVDAAIVALTLRVQGGRPSAPRAEAPLITRSNYFRGPDVSRWRSNVPSFARIRYPAVLDGVDLVYHGEGHALEYDFVV